MLHVEQVNEDHRALITRLAERYDLNLPPGSIHRLEGYVEMLVQWNAKHNLISRSDIGNIWPRHVLHSLIPVLLFRIPSGLKFLDIGSGGGLPGVPIAIVRPDLTGVLVDSIRKKTEALKAMVAEIGIPNVLVVHERVEGSQFVRQHQSSFDLVFARGVSQLPQLVKWSAKLLRRRSAGPKGGTAEGKVLINPPAIVAFKGGDVKDEIERTRQLFPGVSVDEHPVDVEGITDQSFTGKKLVIVGMRT